MKKFKQVYQVRQGKLIVFDVLDEHNMAPGATEETYLCRDKEGRVYCTAKEHAGFETALEAWQDYAEALEVNIEWHKEKELEAIQDRKETEIVLAKVKQTINQLTEASIPTNNA